MLTDQDFDDALLADVLDQWRKVAMVVALTMGDLKHHAHGKNDLFFANRVMLLAQNGIIDSQGDLTQMRYSEVRLKQK